MINSLYFELSVFGISIFSPFSNNNIIIKGQPSGFPTINLICFLLCYLFQIQFYAIVCCCSAMVARLSRDPRPVGSIPVDAMGFLTLSLQVRSLNWDLDMSPFYLVKNKKNLYTKRLFFSLF